MAQILVRNMEEQTVKRLKARARKKGHSLQAEVKEIFHIHPTAREEMDYPIAIRFRI